MKMLTLKPFVPSGKDYAESRRFFSDLGFTESWGSDEVCELQMGSVCFLLQNYCNTELQRNLMMRVTVDDLEALWRHINESRVLDRYAGVRASEPTLYPWGEREVHLIDPAGVCWHFAE